MKEYKIILFNDNEVKDVYEEYASTLAIACERVVRNAIARLSCGGVEVDILEQKFYDDCAEAEVLKTDLYYMTDRRYFFFAREFKEKDEDLL